MSTPHRPAPRSRRPVSRERYLARRVGALVVVGLVLFAAVRVLGAITGALFGADDTEAVAPQDGGTDDTSGAATAGATGGEGTVPVTGPGADPGADPAGGTTVPGAVTSTPGAPTTAGAATPAAPAVPTAGDPAVVLIAGDSDAGTFGPYLETLMDDTGVVRTQLDYKVSSGLSRPDFFDWPSHFRQIVPQVQPDIVVVTFGGNDPQGLTDGVAADGSPNFIVGEPTDDEADWRAEYGRRVGAVMDYLSSEGRTLVWVGIPNDDNPDVTAGLRVQDEVVRAEAAKRPQVQFVDTWNRFSGREGGWAEFVIDPRDKQAKDVRADDGFHLNTVGAEILALDIAEVVIADLQARGAAI